MSGREARWPLEELLCNLRDRLLKGDIELLPLQRDQFHDLPEGWASHVSDLCVNKYAAKQELNPVIALLDYLYGNDSTTGRIHEIRDNTNAVLAAVEAIRKACTILQKTLSNKPQRSWLDPEVTKADSRTCEQILENAYYLQASDATGFQEALIALRQLRLDTEVLLENISQVYSGEMSDLPSLIVDIAVATEIPDNIKKRFLQIGSNFSINWYSDLNGQAELERVYEDKRKEQNERPPFMVSAWETGRKFYRPTNPREMKTLWLQNTDPDAVFFGSEKFWFDTVAGPVGLGRRILEIMKVVKPTFNRRTVQWDWWDDDEYWIKTVNGEYGHGTRYMTYEEKATYFHYCARIRSLCLGLDQQWRELDGNKKRLDSFVAIYNKYGCTMGHLLHFRSMLDALYYSGFHPLEEKATDFLTKIKGLQASIMIGANHSIWPEWWCVKEAYQTLSEHIQLLSQTDLTFDRARAIGGEISCTQSGQTKHSGQPLPSSSTHQIICGVSKLDFSKMERLRFAIGRDADLKPYFEHSTNPSHVATSASWIALPKSTMKGIRMGETKPNAFELVRINSKPGFKSESGSVPWNEQKQSLLYGCRIDFDQPLLVSHAACWITSCDLDFKRTNENPALQINVWVEKFDYYSGGMLIHAAINIDGYESEPTAVNLRVGWIAYRQNDNPVNNSDMDRNIFCATENIEIDGDQDCSFMNGPLPGKYFQYTPGLFREPPRVMVGLCGWDTRRAASQFSLETGIATKDGIWVTASKQSGSVRAANYTLVAVARSKVIEPVT